MNKLPSTRPRTKKGCANWHKCISLALIDAVLGNLGSVAIPNCFISGERWEMSLLLLVGVVSAKTSTARAPVAEEEIVVVVGGEEN